MYKMEVKINKLTKKYGTKIAIDNIDLVIPKGSFTIILGPSGSGKTTLLKVISGLLYAENGDIYFNEQNVSEVPANKRNIAMVFQSYPLFPHMTIEKNLSFPLESQKEGNLIKRNIYSEEEIKEKTDSTLKFLHLEEHRNKYPSQLSGGEKQRIAMGRELIRNPALFLFDEPLSNIDARLRHEMRTWIRKFHGMVNKTMIYVTHDQSEAMALGDLIVLLNEGKIVQIGTPDDLYYEPSDIFVAQFIGNFPMNFLEFETQKNSIHIKENEKIKLPEEIAKIIRSQKITVGKIGFRAESVRENDPKKPIEKDMIELECTVEDVEKVLDQQVISLLFNGKELFYVTKTRKKFKIEDKISILIQAKNLYLFDNRGKRIS